MDIQELLENMRHDQGDAFRRLRPRTVILFLVVVLLIVAVIGSVYTVPTDSAGVVQRFGKYSRTTRPGIHMKLPFLIETAVAVPVQKVQKEEFGFRTLKAGVDSQFLDADEINSGRAREKDLWDLIVNSGERMDGPSQLRQASRDVLQREYVMLTGDLNIIDVQWTVQYRVGDPRKFLFNVRSPLHTVRDASQAVMRQLVGNGSVDKALTFGRIGIAGEAKKGLQELLDKYETGIQVVTVELQSSNPPQRVRPAFNEVNKAQQQKEQRIREAENTFNEAIPMAEGEAKKQIETAKGYAAERVNRAKGDVAKFESIYAEYQKAPDITKKRMYIETMAKVLPTIKEKWIIEQDGAEGGILMKLNLDGQDD